MNETAREANDRPTRVILWVEVSFTSATVLQGAMGERFGLPHLHRKALSAQVQDALETAVVGKNNSSEELNRRPVGLDQMFGLSLRHCNFPVDAGKLSIRTPRTTHDAAQPKNLRSRASSFICIPITQIR